VAQVTVPEGTATAIANSANGLVQNLGPGVLYVDNSSSVDEDTSVRVDVGQAISLAGLTTLHGVASGDDCDVRVLQLANGIHGG
jgi:hypothetical protein